MKLRRLAAVLLGLTVILPLVLPANAGSEDPWTFEGGGWGHGVGLSQYGSQGMALEGYTVEQIVDHYYSGADVKTLSQVGAPSWLTDPEAIWVGVSSGQTGRSFKAIEDGGDLQVCQADGASETCETLVEGHLMVVEVVNTNPLRCQRTIDGNETVGDCWFDIPLESAATSTGIEQGGQKYVRGTMRIRPNSSQEPYSGHGTHFHVSVSVDLEHYIYGIAETILSWKPAALETQAVIARSYGVRKAIDRADLDGEVNNGSKVSCWCHLSASPAVDQNYDGWDLDNEGSSTHGQKWRDAVDDTAAEIVTHPLVGSGNTIISTFYSSSNGGGSEDNEDVWGGTPLPYLRSIDDPWSADPGVNPLATWTVQVTNANMQAYLGWDKVYDATILEGPPGVRVRFDGKDNGIATTTTLSGTQVRALLNTYGFNYHAPGTPSTAVRVSPYISGVSDPPVPFSDIEGSVFEDAIEWLYEEGITVGCNPPSNTLFCVNGKVTRGEMGVFISRAVPLPAPTGDYFSDDDGEFWEGGANRMYEAGITVGCGGTNYCGAQNLPREQMAVFLVRALKLPPTGTDYFVDDENSPYEDHINRIAAAKITLGCNPPANDRFCPKDTVTRGQMSAFIKRAWGK